MTMTSDAHEAGALPGISESSSSHSTHNSINAVRSQSRTFSRSRSTCVVSTSPGPRSSQSPATRASGSTAILSRGRLAKRAGNGDNGEDSASRWRSESRTLRGSIDTSAHRSRSRSVNPFTNRKASASVDRNGPAKSTQTSKAAGAQAAAAGDAGTDIEKAELASPPPPWFIRHLRKAKSPLEPLLKWMPLWLEGYVWGWIGGFVGVGIVMLVFTRINAFTNSADVPIGPWSSPVIVGSFGASAVLLYAAPGSPLSQPRPFFFGQVLSALVGVCVTKLFALSDRFDISTTDHSWSLVWVAGSVATATAILVMQITRTIHPPGGATAVLSATYAPIIRLGWRYIPVVILSSALMLIWAVLWLNLGRRSYPAWWFFPPEEVRKAAFPGPELGLYMQKLKKRRRQKPEEKQSEALPAQKQQSKSERHHEAQQQQTEAATTARHGDGRIPGDGEWHDETAWTHERQEHGQNLDGIARQEEEEEERQSRWARS